MLEIKCKERNDAKVLYWFSAVLSLASAYIFYLAFQPASKAGAWFGAFGFLIFGGILYAFATYQKNKYQKLGDTPLALDDSSGFIGGHLKGRIRINKPNFTLVNSVTLSNWHYRGGNNSTEYNQLSAETTNCKIVPDNNITWLEFDVSVPENGRATEHYGNGEYYWLLSIEFTKDLSLFKRSWPVHVSFKKST